MGGRGINTKAAARARRRGASRAGRNLSWEFKRTGYSLLARSWKGTVAAAIAFGLLCGLVFTGYNYYQDYTAASATVSVVYPEIADGTYPDGSRFTMYSFADEQAVSAVLEQMQAEGKYQAFTAEELMQGITVTAVADTAVGETVTSMQSEGNNYSYYSSEYRIQFTQPRQGQGFSLDQFTEEDHSADFLQRLIQYKQAEISQLYGGYTGFEGLSTADVPDTLDYDEWVTSFGANNRAIRGFLRDINQSAGNFHSPTTGNTISDLVGLFTTMGEERLEEIANYIKNSGLTKDRESFLNKLNVEIENTTLDYNKAVGAVEINRYAMDTYDHTFTENLLIVATSDGTGLYQARPKTVFDTVVDQYNDANNRSIEYASSLRDMQEDLAIYQQIDEASAEYQRLVERCDQLIAAYEADYQALCETAQATLADYLAFRNNGYLNYKVEPNQLFSTGFLLRIALVCLTGALVVVMLRVVFAPLGDRRELRRRRRELQRGARAQGAKRPARAAGKGV